MSKYVYYSLILLKITLLSNLLATDITDFFKVSSPVWDQYSVITDPLVLQSVAKQALIYLDTCKLSADKKLKSKDFNKKLMSKNKTRQTLQYLIDLIEEDKISGEYRILDSQFLKDNFRFIKWVGDTKEANHNNFDIPKDYIRFTKYAIFINSASYQKDSKHPYALYEIIDKNFAQNGRLKYTKQDVLNGALQSFWNKKNVKPLAWVNEQGLEDALMQGTILVKFPDNKYKFFNVDKNNGYEYNKKIKDSKSQKRYWYFKPVNNNKYISKDSGLQLNNGNFIYPQVVFAGDIYTIGFGKIIAVCYKNKLTNKKEIRLGVLADTGGAFTNNLYQLDYFMGIFDSKDHFYQKISRLPNIAQAYILAKKG